MSDLTLNRPDSPAPTNGRSVEAEALEAAQRRLTAFEAILNDLPLGVFMADAKTGLPQFVNKAGLELLGPGVNPQRGQSDSTEVYRLYLPRSNQLYPVQDLPIVRTMATGQPAQGEMDIQQAERRVTVNVTTVPIRDAEGRVVSAAALYQPVADHLPTETALLESQPIFHTFIEASGSVPYRRDHAAGRYTYMGEGIRALTGYGPEEMTTHLLESLIQENIPMGEAKAYGSLAEAVEQAQRGQLSTWRSDLRIKTRDGQTRWLSDASIEIKDATGASVGSIGILQDITERKQAEATLRVSEERFSKAFAGVPAAMSINRMDDARFMEINERFTALLGWTAEETIGRTGPDLQLWLNPEERTRMYDLLHRDGRVRDFPTQFQTKTGETRDILFSCEIFEVGGEQYMLGMLADITERKQAEQILREREEDLVALLEFSPEAIGVVNTQTGLFDNVNSAAERLYGLPRAELVKVGPAQMSPEFQPDGRPSLDQALEKIGAALRGERPVFEWTHRNAAGQLIPCEVRLVGLAAPRQHLVRFSVTDITERKRAETALAKRATELEVVAQVGAAAATILEPLQLLQTVVNLTKSNFKLYHAHVYLLNDAGDALELAAGAGEVGHKMVAQGWRIPLSREQSLVARAARTQTGVIINDVTEEPGFLPNALLPDTRSEMAVPIAIGGLLLGVLDVQADEPGRFTDEDLRIQGILATQIAVALQNARQFAEARRLADREALVNAISQQIQNATTVESALQIAARELGRALGAQRTVVQLGQPDNAPR